MDLALAGDHKLVIFSLNGKDLDGIDRFVGKFVVDLNKIVELRHLTYLLYNSCIDMQLLSYGSLGLKIRRDETSPGHLLRLSSSVGASCGWLTLAEIIGLVRVGSGGNCGESERGAWKARLDWWICSLLENFWSRILRVLGKLGWSKCRLVMLVIGEL